MGVDPLPQLPVGFWVDLRPLTLRFHGYTVKEGEDLSRVQAALEIRQSENPSCSIGSPIAAPVGNDGLRGHGHIVQQRA
jgi:hypothetical protein